MTKNEKSLFTVVIILSISLLGCFGFSMYTAFSRATEQYRYGSSETDQLQAIAERVCKDHKLNYSGVNNKNDASFDLRCTK